MDALMGAPAWRSSFREHLGKQIPAIEAISYAVAEQLLAA
jgi:hypothetical protein